LCNLFAHSVPTILVLNGLGIDQAGSAEDLKNKCNTVKELDLAQNKLENWNEVIIVVAVHFRFRFSLKIFSLSCDTDLYF
jgi:hypothetical protein